MHRDTKPAVGALTTDPISVLQLDSMPLFREGTAAVLGRTEGLRFLGSGSSPNGILALCERHHPQVLLVDSLTDPRAALSQLIRQTEPATAVMMLVQRSDARRDRLERARMCGVRGLVPRMLPAHTLISAIRAVAAGQTVVTPPLDGLVSGSPDAEAKTPSAMLSRREFQVLQLIAEGRENARIAADLFVSVETIRTHVKSILRKLGARDRAHAIALAYRSGLASTGIGDDPIQALSPNGRGDEHGRQDPPRQDPPRQEQPRQEQPGRPTAMQPAPVVSAWPKTPRG